MLESNAMVDAKEDKNTADPSIEFMSIKPNRSTFIFLFSTSSCEFKVFTPMTEI
jgi:hypothetical protein